MIWMLSFEHNVSATLQLKEGKDWQFLHNQMGKRTDIPLPLLQARIIEGEPKHFVHLGGDPVCSAAVWEVLRPHLEEEVQDLPIIVEDEPYFLLNVVNIVDCLDVPASQMIYSPLGNGSIIDIRRYAFHLDKVGRSKLFRIPQLPARVFATASFCDLVAKHSFVGLHFEQPYSPLDKIAEMARAGFRPPLED